MWSVQDVAGLVHWCLSLVTQLGYDKTGVTCRVPNHSRVFSSSQLSGEEGEESFVRLFSDTTFDCTFSFALHSFETGCSVITCQFLDDAQVGGSLLVGNKLYWSKDFSFVAFSTAVL